MNDAFLAGFRSCWALFKGSGALADVPWARLRPLQACRRHSRLDRLPSPASATSSSFVSLGHVTDLNGWLEAMVDLSSNASTALGTF
jgi:hypothetical protein